MASNLINLTDGLKSHQKPSAMLEAIMLAIITHQRSSPCNVASVASQVYSAPSLAIKKIKNHLSHMSANKRYLLEGSITWY